MMSDIRTLSLLGENHFDHDPIWTLPGVRPQSLICIACLTESLQNSEQLVVRKKVLLRELLALLTSVSRSDIWEVLSTDENVLEHLLRTISSLLQSPDTDLTAVAIEILVLLCCQLKSDDLVYFLIQEVIAKVESGCGYQEGLPYLTLIGQLLQAIPALSAMLAQHGDTLLDYLVSGLSFPSEEVRTAITFVLTRLVGALRDDGSDLYPQLCLQISRGILPIISSSQTQLLQANALGLLRRLLESEELTCMILKPENQPSFTSVVKKLLLNRNEVIRISCVQCISQVVVQDAPVEGRSGASHTERFLDEDVAEFLYEALSTTNSLLLSSIFCCLLLLSKHEAFFTKCHTVYGIEAIVRALQQCQKMSSIETLHRGLQLLSEILLKQPEDVKLLTSLNISHHICEVLTPSIKHQENSISLEAVGAFCHLLRRDHLPSPVDFKSLVGPLDGTLAVLHRLPRPLVKPRKHSREARLGKGTREMKEEASRKHQEVLELVMKVMVKALGLCCVCREDPGADPGVFFKPKTANPKLGSSSHDQSSSPPDGPSCENNLVSFTLYLMEALDSICIPTIMESHECLSQPNIYTFLLESLDLMIELQQEEDIIKMSEKFAASSFIRIALEVRHKFQSKQGAEQLKKATDNFLVNLICTLSSGDDTSSMGQETLGKVISNISGSPEELCHLLDHHPSVIDGCGESTSDVQRCILAILYYAWLHGDRWISSNDLLEVLSQFITQHPDIGALPPSSTKHLLYLYADCCVQSGCHVGNSGCYILADHVSRQDMGDVFTKDQCLVHWVFAVSNIPEQAANKIFTEWLHNLPETTSLEGEEADDSDTSFTLQLMAERSSCIDIMLDSMQRSTPSTGNMCAALIGHMLKSRSPGLVSRQVEKIKTRMPELLQGLLMTDHPECTGAGLGSVLEVVSTVYLYHPSQELAETDLKIIYRVMNILTKQTPADDSVILASLNFLTAVLVHSASRGESRALSLVISNVSVLTLLQELATHDPSQANLSPNVSVKCATLTLLAYLTLYQKVYKMKVSHTVHIEEQYLISSLACSSRQVQQLASIHLLTALFWSSSSPSQPHPAPAVVPSSSATTSTPLPALVKLHLTGKRQLLEEQDLGLPVAFSTLRQVYAMLQNSILQGSDLVLAAAVGCMKAMVCMAMDRNPKAASHILGQPWNQMLINCSVEIYQESTLMGQAVLQLVTMFLVQGNSQGFVRQQHIDSLLDTIVRTDPAQLDYPMLPVLEFIHAVQCRPELVVGKKQRQDVSSWIEKLQDHLHQLPHDEFTEPELVRLNGVITSTQFLQFAKQQQAEEHSRLVKKIVGMINFPVTDQSSVK